MTGVCRWKDKTLLKPLLLFETLGIDSAQSQSAGASFSRQAFGLS